MGKRVDFTTTEERINWLKATAARQEISVSQLLNRLIRNRILQESKYKKSDEWTPVPKNGFYTKASSNTDQTNTKKLGDCSREELGDELYDLIHQNDKKEEEEEEEMPF